ncbi:MAG: adenylate/guanylate cyclase domain-containing protein [Bacteroidia bacterium]|nr:adenylate/guanylate cyclase domain-containing protein [Bacteroidia bacterium]
MNRIGLVLAGTCLLHMLSAAPADSLQAMLAQAGNDRAYISILLSGAEQYLRTYPDTAMIFAREALVRDSADRYKLMQAQAHAILGDAYWQKSLFPAALSHYLEAMKRYEVNEDEAGQARIYEGMGNIEWQYGHYPNAMERHYKALRLRERLRDSLGIAASLFRIGIVQAEMGDYRSALSAYDRALGIATRHQQKTLMADILHFTGRAWRKQDIYNNALVAHEKSRVLYEELGDLSGLADYYNNVGSIYRRQGQYMEALRFFQQGLALQQQLQDNDGLADGYNDIGTTYSQMRRFPEALRYLRQALDIARKAGLRDDIRYAYTSLAATYDSLGDYRNAYRYYLSATLLRDSLLNERSNSEISSLTLRYEREARQRELEIVQAESHLQRSYVQLVLLGALAALALVIMYFQIRSRTRRRVFLQLKSQKEQIEREQEKAEKLLLNILPADTVRELKASGKGIIEPRYYDDVTVMFTDFKGFTTFAESLTPRQVIDELHYCFAAFDKIISRYKIEKIKTIGDAYMCAAGLPLPSDTHVEDILRAGLEIQGFMKRYIETRKAQGRPWFEVRVGVHTGPVIAGVVGTIKYAYDIWGDTVNTASRMESSGEVGCVNVSQTTYLRVKDLFLFRYRGKIPAKNKGEIEMYVAEWEI